jgi:hypothetical protein
MKKIILAAFVLSILASCGPHRMKCGPGRRCMQEPEKETITVIRDS